MPLDANDFPWYYQPTLQNNFSLRCTCGGTWVSKVAFWNDYTMYIAETKCPRCGLYDSIYAIDGEYKGYTFLFSLLGKA